MQQSQSQISVQSEKVNIENLENYFNKVNEFIELILQKIDQLQMKCSSVAKSFNNDQQIIFIAKVFDRDQLEYVIEQIKIMENQVKFGGSQIVIEKSKLDESLEICQKLFESQQYQQSINLLNQLDQNNDKVLFWKAKNLHRLNYIEEAKQLYKKVININPENELAYNNLGNILLQEGKYEEALQFFENSLQQNDNNANFHLNKGVALLKLQKYEDALIELFIALEITPKLEQAYLQISETLIKMNYTRLALYYLDKAIRHFPNYHRFYYDKGVILLKESQTPDAKETIDALDCFNKALQYVEKNPNYLQLKAKTLAFMNKIEEAIKEYEKILQIEGYKHKKGITDEIFKLKELLQNRQNQ